MEQLKNRIAKVIEVTGWSNAELARVADVSKASVTHWLNGATMALKAESAANISKKSGFRTEWLIDGKGRMMAEPETTQSLASSPAWPFEHVISYARWEMLTERQKGYIEKAIRDELRTIESEPHKGNSHAA